MTTSFCMMTNTQTNAATASKQHNIHEDDILQQPHRPSVAGTVRLDLV